MRPTTLSAFVAAAFLASTTRVAARPEFVARIPNGANVPGVEAVGHVNPEGDGPRNAFGEGFDEAGYMWTVELCQADSDGDGQTNGQELGDPCCEFVADSNPAVRWADGVSHPGDSSLTSDPSLWATVNCSNVTSTAANTSDSSCASSSDAEVGGKDGGSDKAGETPTTTPTSAAATHTTTLIAGATSLAISLAALW